MKKHKPATKRALLIRVALSVIVLAAAVYVLAAHWPAVEGSLGVARGASIAWLAVSLLGMVATFGIAAAIYGVLAFRRLHYWQTATVEVAAAFVNRLLPSGLGGLGLHGVYLYKRGHTAAEATVVVSVNNLVGMLAHLLLLATVLAFRPEVIHRFVHGGHVGDWKVLAGLGALLVVVLALPFVRTRVARFVQNLLASVRKIKPHTVGRALLLAMLLTAVYTMVLFAAARSVGVNLSVLQVFIVFSLGMLVSTATPTPGGLVGAEAGLFAGFVAYGVPAPLAGAAVLLYRLVSYWLPLLPGALALLLARKRQLV